MEVFGRNIFYRWNGVVIICLFLMVSCVNQGGGRRSLLNSTVNSKLTEGSPSDDSGKTSITDTTGQTIGSTIVSDKGRAEIRHLVDPFDGTYKTKVTIPKNFTGYFYISGLNIASLSDRVIYARFNFGRELEPVVIEGTIGRAPGITPQTDIEVLILDMHDRPFEDIRLLYDLYDYNEYRIDGSTSETKDPVTDPRDGGLYCRGLKLQHDPTFEAYSSSAKCDGSSSEKKQCLYSYAKIVDQGLVEQVSGLAINPSMPQIDLVGNGYANITDTEALKKCLPDNNDVANIYAVLGLTNVPAAISYGGALSETLNGVTYLYKGPYRAISWSSTSTDWQITSDAMFSDLSNASTKPTGLFQKMYATGGNPNPNYGYKSFLFPRVGSVDLNAEVEHFGTSLPFPLPYSRGSVPVKLIAAGESYYMDGCNLRVMNYYQDLNEGISSCNVTATIELFYKDANAEEVIISSSRDIKLQLIQASSTDYEGKEVLYSALKNCSSSNACGANECCFNNRCWSKNLVSQCKEEVASTGNLGTGERCSSDFECASLCCNQVTGACAVHINTEDDQVLCQKSPGQQCVAKEWCRVESIPTCNIYKTGLTPEGKVTCALRCVYQPTFGDCVNGYCTQPVTPTPPFFDPSNPDCTNALDPATEI